MSKYWRLALSAYRQQRHLLDDVAITLAVNLVGTLLLFLALVLLARLMGVGEFSLYTYSFAVLSIAATLSVFGFDVAVLRFVPTALAHNDWAIHRGYIRRAIQVTVLASVFGGILLAAAVASFGGRLTPGLPQTLMVAVATIPLASLLLLYAAYARALKRPLLAAAPRLLLKPVAFVAIAAALAFWGPPLTADRVMAAELMATLITVVFIAWAVSKQLRPSFRGVKPSFDTRIWVGVSFPLFLTAAFQLLMRQIDILILGSFLGADTVGPYAAASRISQLAAFGLLSINAVLPGLVSKHLAKGELDLARKIVGVASLVIFAFSAGAGAVLWVFSEQFLGLFGDAFRKEVPVLHILIAGQILNAMTGSVSYILAITGQQKILAKIVFSALLLNTLLCLALIPPLGAKGAAIAVALSTSISNVVLAIICMRRTGIDPSIYGALKRMRAR